MSSKSRITIVKETTKEAFLEHFVSNGLNFAEAQCIINTKLMPLLQQLPPGEKCNKGFYRNVGNFCRVLAGAVVISQGLPLKMQGSDNLKEKQAKNPFFYLIAKVYHDRTDELEGPLATMHDKLVEGVKGVDSTIKVTINRTDITAILINMKRMRKKAEYKNNKGFHGIVTLYEWLSINMPSGKEST